MAGQNVSTKQQADAYSSSWSREERALMVLWSVVWVCLFRPTPKFLFPWRVWLLRIFGAQISGRPFVSESAWVKIPWNLVLEDRACLGPACDVYNLGVVTLRARCTVSRHVAICAGGHDISTSLLPLQTAPIEIGADAFIGSHAMILLGTTVGEGCVIGAGSVVVKDMPPWQICAGNPCQPIKPRKFVRQ